MKLLLNSPNNRLRYKVDRIDSARTRTPFSNINDNNLAFSGREKLIQELAGETEKLVPKLLNKAKRIFIVLGGKLLSMKELKKMSHRL